MELLEYAYGRSVFIAEILLLGVLCYNLGFVIHNLLIHPLSRFPGPGYAGASQIPCAWYTFRGKLPHWLKHLHDAYGSDVVRFSPKELSFINASAWKDIHGNQPGRLPYEKDPAVYTIPPNGTASLLTAKRADHVRMRRVLGHAFSDRATRDQEPIMEGYVNLLMERLLEQASGPQRGKVDISMWFRWLAFDITGDLSFGESFNCLQNEQFRVWADMIAPWLKVDICLAACNRFRGLRHFLPRLISSKTMTMMQDHFKASTEKVSRRMKLGSSRPDFITPIMKFNEEGKGLTDTEIQSNASLFIVAGSETSATILTGAIYYLLHNPTALHKLKAEIRSAFATEEEIKVQSVASLPYLLACLDETHRIYPAVLTGQSVVVPPQGDMIGNEWLPGGTGLSINMYAAYRSERNFKDPLAYVPERWLGDPRFAKDQRDVFHPFSHGSRSCIGKRLGNAETRLVLARFLWRFDIELSEETDPEWLDQEAFVAWQRKPLFIRLSERT